MHPGGILVSYLPTINQTARLREELEASAFGMAQTIEILLRSWHIEGQSVRPDHRMVAHTGFLTAARLLDGGQGDTPAVLPPQIQETQTQEPEARGAESDPDDDRSGGGTPADAT
jgi:hypothetical protein